MGLNILVSSLIIKLMVRVHGNLKMGIIILENFKMIQGLVKVNIYGLAVIPMKVKCWIMN